MPQTAFCRVNRKWLRAPEPFSWPVFFATLSFEVLLLASPVQSEEHAASLALPKLAACDAKAHPRLPEKWRATYLMAPFTKTQLVLGDIVHDDSLPASRFTLYGLKRGSLDLFVHDGKTYELTSNGSAVAGCRSLGDTGWRPLRRDWLAPQSQCAGSAPVGGMLADWWKSPIEPAPSSYWVWYKASDQTPLRVVFQSSNDRLAAFGHYAMSHQVRFQPVAETDLAHIADVCKPAKAATLRQAPEALRERIDSMSQAGDRAHGAIKKLMPELATCAATPFPAWPSRLALTGLMTPFDFNENPYPTEVLYDWTVPAQRSRIFFPSSSGNSMQDALLLGPQGYNVTYRRQGGPTCALVLPGTLRPDWPARAPCECQAVIGGTTPLTPGGTTRIMVCPLASPRVAWTWYTATGRPKLFMVTSMPGDEGAGLFAVLDYWDWLPGHQVPRAAFARPASCEALQQAGPGTHSGRRTPLAMGQCSSCHLGGTSAR